MKMSFRNLINFLLKKPPSAGQVSENQQETISELKKLIEKQHEIIRELKEHSEGTIIPDKQHEEIERLKKEVNRYQELVRTYEESVTKLNAQLEDIRLIYQKERVMSQEEIEKKTSLIREFETSAKTLKNNFEEISNRYHEAIEKYETEKQNAICLEMLILDLDKEIGLINIAEKINLKEEETIGIMIKNPR